MKYSFTQFYIDGRWVDPVEPRPLEVINPATEEPVGRISLGSAADVDRAVAAARRAFPGWSATSVDERISLFERILAAYKRRIDDIAEAICDEVGAPLWLAKQAQAAAGLGQFGSTLAALKSFAFEESRGGTRLRYEPIGVCALITPWNWPINQIACKVAPALAAGCTMVLKPSEVAPLNACLLAEVLDAAGVTAGVFNLVNGDGPTVGTALAAHSDVDMVSFTGSTRAGVEVAKNAAPTVKRVHQELGGKSPNIVLEDADLSRAVKQGIRAVCNNSGQSCNAPTRMLVPAARLDEVEAIARETLAKIVVGEPREEGVHLGPLISKRQFDRVRDYIRKGIEEGATLVGGGPDRPAKFDRGYYVEPTVFSRAANDMTIAREEIFGPVLTIIPYQDEEDAIAIANDTPYGLSAYVQSGDLEHARAVARRIRAGMVHLNGAQLDPDAPFGGYKQSGNGREWGVHGLKEFLEIKVMLGYG
jgi:aldehyde dehydrogenase (NAD+)